MGDYVYEWEDDVKLIRLDTCLRLLPSAKEIETLHGGLKTPAMKFWTNNNDTDR